MERTIKLLLVTLTLTACSTIKYEKVTTRLTSVDSNIVSKDGRSQSTLFSVALHDNDAKVRKSAIKRLN